MWFVIELLGRGIHNEFTVSDINGQRTMSTSSIPSIMSFRERRSRESLGSRSWRFESRSSSTAQARCPRNVETTEAAQPKLAAKAAEVRE